MDYNLVVLGATPGGIAAAIAAARGQARVALVAQAESWPLGAAGGWSGAMRGTLGQSGRWPAGMPQPGDLARLGIDVIVARGRFERRGRERWVQVDDRTLRGQAYLLAPGPVGGGNWVQWVERAAPGARVQVRGDRSAGLVLAQVLAKRGRFSCREASPTVTVVTEHGTLLCPSDPHDPGYGRYDRELAYLLQCQLEADGVGVRTQMDFAALESSGVKSAEASVLLNQDERPDFEGWGLEAIGLGLEANGRPWSANLRCRIRSVWVCGLAATSGAGVDQPWIEEAEARQVVRRLLAWPRSSRSIGPLLPWVVGTTTPLVSLGLTEELARARGLRVLRADLGESWRGQMEGQTIGRLKMIADRRGRILGAHALAAEAPEWMGIIGLAMQRGVTLAQLSELPIASTTYAALIVQLAEPKRSARQDYWAERWLNWRRTGSV